MPIYTYTTLDNPSSVGFNTYGQGINDAGQVVGSYTDNSGLLARGYLYSGGTFLPIDDPLATAYTNAVGINASGVIVGLY